MKYCLSNNQTKSILKDISEIKFSYQNRHKIIEFIKWHSKKTYILQIPPDIDPQSLPWNDFIQYSKISNFKLNIDPSLIDQCRDLQLNFYLTQPATSYEQLNSLILTGVSDVFLGSTLFFDLPNVKKLIKKLNAKTQIRAIPNAANTSLFISPLVGTYIRPEDIPTYEPYIDILEFSFDTSPQELTLLDIYKRQNWKADLSFLIRDLNTSIPNPLIPETFAQTRINCGQRCLKNHLCSFCLNTVKYLNIPQGQK